MGIAERKEREKQQRIDMILDAAEKVFEEKGLKNATMDEIAEQAELSKGTLYLYFKSKEVIFVGIEHRGTSLLAEYFSQAVKSKRKGIDKVRAVGRAYYQFSEDHPNYFSTMSNFEKVDPELVKRIQDDPLVQQCQASGMRVLEILAEAIQVGIDDGSVREDVDAMKTAVLLWAQSNGVIQMHRHRAAHISLIKGFGPDFLLTELDKAIAAALTPPAKTKRKSV